jgi:hypothetical protein
MAAKNFLFIGVGSSGAIPRHLVIAIVLTQFIQHFIPWCGGSFDAKDLFAKISLS